MCGTIPQSRATFIATSESGGEDRQLAERGLLLGDRWLACLLAGRDAAWEQ
jgi:hypothetical protein